MESPNDDDEWDGAEYLRSLSAEQRDAVLEAIEYVDIPRHYMFHNSEVMEMLADCSVLNYSAMFNELSTETVSSLDIPKPSDLRTGDRLQFGDYRGTGTYYVMWLRKGSHTTMSEELLSAFSNALSSYSGDKKFFFMEDHPQEIDEMQVPTLRCRDDVGPHNDGQHECIMFTYPDEYGYGPASVMSTMKLSYFCPEFQIALIDPLLSHSMSINGKRIEKEKQDSKWHSNEDFPLRYVGIYDEEMYFDTVEWVLEDDCQEMEYCVHENYVTDLRNTLARHFSLTLQ